MSKVTMATLTARLDKASEICVAMQERIQELEAQVGALREQEDKTRKQLWYLQKVAKGEFKPRTLAHPGITLNEVEAKKEVTETQQQAHDDAYAGVEF